MLLHLSIQNYALIRHLEIDFTPGLTVITGETGAGKSILIGALDLILGKRADTKALLDKSMKCIVEGTFEASREGIDIFLSSHDLDFDNPMYIRREINPQGKSRAFINDTPVKLNVLKELGAMMIDIHSQHQNLNLGDSSFQFSLIDSFAGISTMVNEYQKNFASLKEMKENLIKLEKTENEINSERDYLEFLLNELQQANLQVGESDELEKEQKLLEHAEEIKSVLLQSTQFLNEEQSGILSHLSGVNKDISKLGEYDETLQDIAGRINSTLIELSDIGDEMERYEEKIDFDPGRSEEVTDRLNLINGLLRKHQVNTIAELFEVKKNIEEKLSEGQSMEQQIERLKKQINTSYKQLEKQAGEISDKRKSVKKELENKTTVLLKALGMPDAQFSIDISDTNKPGKFGTNSMSYLFNANRGGELREVSVVASGGEKSRLMLAMKSLLSRRNVLPTIVFDEIDAGVSGIVADKVGDILEKMSAHIQVIAITHLPQIAGKGNKHFLVFKEEKEGRTQTFIKDLIPDERIMEIAKMMSGKKLSSATVESARNLLNN